MTTDLLDIQRQLSSKGIIISLTGRHTQTLIVEYGEALKAYLEGQNRPQNEIFNIFSLFIEQTQNINNYCGSKVNTSHFDTIIQSSIIVIGKTDMGSFVGSGNMIANEDIAELDSHLQTIISRDKQDLKWMYKEKLRQGLAADSRSAGLGFIDMARRASYPLEYTITANTKSLSFFMLKAIV